MPFADATFSAAVCFTMLHHVPSPEAQDTLLAEVLRVLRPGAPFAGTDSTGRGIGFALLHVGDTNVPCRPDDLARRSLSSGFRTWRWRATATAIGFAPAAPGVARDGSHCRDSDISVGRL